MFNFIMGMLGKFQATKVVSTSGQFGPPGAGSNWVCHGDSC